jgi:hypothetical protein
VYSAACVRVARWGIDLLVWVGFGALRSFVSDISTSFYQSVPARWEDCMKMLLWEGESVLLV